MKKLNILYATFRGEDLEKGFSYAVELARTLDRDLYLLVVTEKSVTEKLGDMFSAAGLAEEGLGGEAAGEIAKGGFTRLDATSDGRYSILANRARMEGVGFEVYGSNRGIRDAISGFVKARSGVDMVLLGPAVSGEGGMSSKELKKLVAGAGKPVVTMRPAMDVGGDGLQAV